jgi:hypothetical protein
MMNLSDVTSVESSGLKQTIQLIPTIVEKITNRQDEIIDS